MRRFYVLVLMIVTLTGCSVQQSQPAHSYSDDARWIVLPFDNHSETPMAADRAEALTLSALRAYRLNAQGADVADDPFELPTFDDRRRYHEALAYARNTGARYGVTGSVVEWRYKSGLDGEPAVGIAMHVVDIGTGDTVWSGSFSRSGWSRESLAGTGQKVIDKLVQGLLRG